jgi:hypothetical protein
MRVTLNEGFFSVELPDEAEVEIDGFAEAVVAFPNGCRSRVFAEAPVVDPTSSDADVLERLWAGGFGGPWEFAAGELPFGPLYRVAYDSGAFGTELGDEAEAVEAVGTAAGPRGGKKRRWWRPYSRH